MFPAVLTTTWATITSPLVVPDGLLRVSDAALPPVVFAVCERREMPEGVEGNEPEGRKAMRWVTLEYVPVLSVPWIVPVAPVEESISWDISDVVLELLAVYHCSVKPEGRVNEVGSMIPTAYTSISLETVVLTPALSTLLTPLLYWVLLASIGEVLSTPT